MNVAIINNAYIYIAFLLSTKYFSCCYRLYIYVTNIYSRINRIWYTKTNKKNKISKF